MKRLWAAFERRFLCSDSGDPVRDQLVYYLSAGALALTALLVVLLALERVLDLETILGRYGLVFPASFLVAYTLVRRGHVRVVGLLLVAAVLALLYSRPPLIVAGTIICYAIIVTGLAVSPRAMFGTAAVAPFVLLHASVVLARDNFLIPVTIGFTTFDPEWFDVEGAQSGYLLPTFGGAAVFNFVFASTAYYLLQRVQAAAAAKAAYEATEKANQELTRLNLELEQLATHDSLTHLTNRGAFMASLEAAIDERQRSDQRLALMFVDLDGFKAVNDTEGHDVGDELLRLVADRLGQTAASTGSKIARLGGDEFVVQVLEDSKGDSALRVGQAILESLAQPYPIQNKQISISCSIGIAIFPDHAALPGDLLRRADQAMYVAKRAGKNRLEVARS